MVHFVGAGPGASDLITVRGKNLLETADVIIYAGSLVNPELLNYACKEASIYNSAVMTLEDVTEVILKAESENKTTVRLHTGDPCLYGAIREQMDFLDEHNIKYDYTPGVSSFCGAAAAVECQYTLPGISQSVIITRMEGRTAMPQNEKMRTLASVGTSMVIFLSTGLLKELTVELLAGGAYSKNTPAAIVYKASWPDEKIFHTDIEHMAQVAEANGIKNTALILVGEFLKQTGYKRSELYNPDFTTAFREGKS